MHSLLLSIACFIFTLKATTSEEKCNFSMYSLKEKENDSTCMKVFQTEAPGIYKVGFRTCENKRQSFCNVYDGFIQPSNFNAKCEDRLKVIQSYPGGTCKENIECLYGICIDNICKDSDVLQFCIRDENCPIGTACMEDDMQIKRCLQLRNENEFCTKTTDCKLNCFCAFKHCMRIFDYEDNTDITPFKEDNVKRLDLICKSGYAARINKKVICLRTKNANSVKDKCNEDCAYKVNDEIMTIPNTCKCGFNYQRSKHCVLGSGEDLYVEYIKMKKELFEDTSHTQHCHTLERFNEGYCAEKIKTDRSIATRRKIQEYNNKRILALEHHRLMYADDCIKEVVFDYDTSPIVPDKRQCAAFSCDSYSQYCAYGTNPLNDEGDHVTISLNEHKCSSDETCIVNHRNRIEFIYENYTMTGECKAKSKDVIMRLPGEYCDKHQDCLSKHCGRSNKCVGKNANESCSSHIDCVQGLFCDNGQCQRQKRERESCESSWDCLNNLGCYSNPNTLQNQCIQFGSVVDIDISQMISKWPIYPEVHIGYNTSELGTGLMCKAGQLSVSKTRCGEYAYDINYPEMNNTNEDNVVECKADSECYYLDNYNTSKILKCECGYNGEGKGYCPLPNSVNKEDWLKMYEMKREETDNQCHTLSRFKCYLNPQSQRIAELELKTTKAHLFYNAVPCANRVLASNRIMVNYPFAFVLLIFFYLY